MERSDIQHSAASTGSIYMELNWFEFTWFIIFIVIIVIINRWMREETLDYVLLRIILRINNKIITYLYISVNLTSTDRAWGCLRFPLRERRIDTKNKTKKP